MVSWTTDMGVWQPLICLKVRTPDKGVRRSLDPVGTQNYWAQGPNVVDKGELDPVARVRTIQKPVYYVSEVLHEAKVRYLETHKLIYAILIASRKLRHYF